MIFVKVRVVAFWIEPDQLVGAVKALEAVTIHSCRRHPLGFVDDDA
jgi:hypothetical protein